MTAESAQGIPMATTPSHRGDKGSAPCRQRPVISRPLSLNDFFIVAKYELGAILPELVVWSLQRVDLGDSWYWIDGPRVLP